MRPFLALIALAGNPLAVAPALVTGAGIGSRTIGDTAQIALLASSYGVSRSQVSHGIRYYLPQGVDGILRHVVAELSQRAGWQTAPPPDSCLRDPVLPYLVLVAHGRTLNRDTEEHIRRHFDRAFGISGVLQQFAARFPSSFTGSALHVSHTTSLVPLARKAILVYFSLN